jgi:antitoxin (DNA-binding transcriptional repressor) of toxin-antitoxin stability system
MTDVSATEAARKFADLLDAVEQRGEHFTIIRRGKAVAHLEPVGLGRGDQAKTLLRRQAADPDWSNDIAKTRRLLLIEDRS